MAFCNACGTSLDPGAKFCKKCGAAVTAGSSAPAVAPTPTAAPGGGGNALKVILIVLAVIIGMGVLGVATVGVIGYHFAKRSHVRHEGDNVKVETPFGTVESSKDPDQAAKNLGIDIYPGAEVQKNGASSATFGGIQSVAASFASADSVDKVCSFYKSRFPNAMVTSSDPNRCTIVSSDRKNMITINIEATGDTTRFQITNVTKQSATSN